MAKLTTIVSFNGTMGLGPSGTLIIDAAGNLLGVTQEGANGLGTLFEIVNTASGYASTPTTIVTFDYATGFPLGGLTADDSGNLLGTALGDSTGTVFEVAKATDSYTSTPKIVATFSESFIPGSPDTGGIPVGALVEDANGDLFGATIDDGSTYAGTVFEIAKTDVGYGIRNTIATFGSTSSAFLNGSLIIDADGNLFGTSLRGGANGGGLVFEIVKTADGYETAPVTLVSFDSGSGISPSGGLTMDANGDLFGTTLEGGTGNAGTVFEVAKTAGGYASAATALVNFDSTTGQSPASGVIIDAEGNLFGTTLSGGANGDGTGFEVAKTAGGYASSPTTLINFDGVNGSNINSGLMADANGNLFGVTALGGASNNGTVFEITDAGFVTCFCPGTHILTDRGEVVVEQLAIGDTVLTAAGEAERVRWIGWRHYDGRFVAGNHLMLPVCIKAGALADGVPSRDLYVSPGHAMFIGGQLVPAWRLVNGVSVVQAEAVESVSYYHVELDCHAVILAQGAPAESFIDDDCRGQFQNAREFHRLYPDVAPMARLQPRLEDGFALQMIQERIAVRAGVATPVEPIGRLRGFVDAAVSGRLYGWAQDMDNPEEPVALEVLVGGEPVLCMLANAYRADLRHVEVGSGCHAFEAQLPDGFVGSVTVRRVTDGAALGQTYAADQMQRAA